MRKTTMVILPMIGLCGCMLDIEKRPLAVPDAAVDEREITDAEADPPEGEIADAEADRPESEVPPLCGNGQCDSGYGETCFNCPEDCPECLCITSGDCPAGYVCDGGRCRPGCSSDGDCSAGLVCVDGVCVGEASVLCSNGVDDDGDGFVDCDDYDCSTNGCVPFCLLEHDLSRCTDGLDNDMDGKTDCEDEQCLFNLNVDACTCGSGSGRECGTDAVCSDGGDDDGDGATDCNDSDCRRDPRVSVCGSENTNQACSDGIDNDSNGATDCNDTLCTSTASVTICCSISGG
jgi:hypothetical protein